MSSALVRAAAWSVPLPSSMLRGCSLPRQVRKSVLPTCASGQASSVAPCCPRLTSGKSSVPNPTTAIFESLSTCWLLAIRPAASASCRMVSGVSLPDSSTSTTACTRGRPSAPTVAGPPAGAATAGAPSGATSTTAPAAAISTRASPRTEPTVRFAISVASPKAHAAPDPPGARSLMHSRSHREIPAETRFGVTRQGMTAHRRKIHRVLWVCGRLRASMWSSFGDHAVPWWMPDRRRPDRCCSGGISCFSAGVVKPLRSTCDHVWPWRSARPVGSRRFGGSFRHFGDGTP